MQMYCPSSVNIVKLMKLNVIKYDRKQGRHCVTPHCVNSGVVRSQHKYLFGKMKMKVNFFSIALCGL